jgi:kinesin family protein 4/21/27
MFERLELECERRRDEARILQERFEGLKKDGRGWWTDLEERERKVRELEAKMEEWKEKKKEAGEAWGRLDGVGVSPTRCNRSGRGLSSTLPRLPVPEVALFPGHRPQTNRNLGSRTS